MKEKLIESLNKKTAVIGIIGLGYVGLPLMIRYTEIGYKVLGIDIDQSKVNDLMQGNSIIKNISAEKIQTALVHGFEATTDFSRLVEADALILCIPTPLNKYREPDLSYVVDTTNSILPYLREGQIVSLESTTYPGTTEEELLPLMGLVIDINDNKMIKKLIKKINKENNKAYIVNMNNKIDSIEDSKAI